MSSQWAWQMCCIPLLPWLSLTPCLLLSQPGIQPLRTVGMMLNVRTYVLNCSGEYSLAHTCINMPDKISEVLLEGRRGTSWRNFEKELYQLFVGQDSKKAWAMMMGKQAPTHITALGTWCAYHKHYMTCQDSPPSHFLDGACQITILLSLSGWIDG